MSKVKYVYDPEKLAYRKIKPKKGRKFGYFALFLVASALFGFLCFVVLLNTSYFETPKDRMMAREIDNMKINYAILNKRIEVLNETMGDLEERDNNVYRTYFNSSPADEELRKGKHHPKTATSNWKVLTIRIW